MVKKKIFPQGKVTVKRFGKRFVIRVGGKNFDEKNQRSSALFEAQRVRVIQAEEKLKIMKEKFRKL